MRFPRLPLSLPFDRLPPAVREHASRLRPYWLVLVIALVLGVLGGRWLLAWGEGQRSLTTTQTQSIEALARGTQSPTVWALYQSEASGGLTRAGAERVRNAAKAAPPPEGLLSN